MEIIKQADNLVFMKSIPDNTIDLIYCDILYGTGRKFDDYQDLKPIRSEIEDHYIPRLKEMHRILSKTGSIYLQMDSKIDHWVRCIMDDIFGYNNFVNKIIWKRSKGVNTTERYYSDVCDHIIFYSKGKDYKFNKQFSEHSDSTVNRYNKTDLNGRAYMLNNIQSKKNFRFEGDFRLLNGEKYYNKPKLGWDWVQETLDKRIAEGYIFEQSSDGTTIQYRRYLDSSEGKLVNTLWEDFSNLTSNADNYDTQKPKALLERIIKASSNEGDIVADFYMGSGTTAVVAKELNRDFIGCDINPRAVEITKKRLSEVNE